MECNKDEAIRAKELAEKKMSSNDYVGARKMILKAQKLYPSTENITQMLIVCEVHCSAECQVHGLDPDWYSILQVEQTADEAFIKKQFRKLALQLHPDKNKFPGAEAAFKLISEAQKLLCDKTTRQTFDWRRMAMRAGPSGQQKQSQPQPIRNNYTSKQPGIYSNPASTGTTARFTSMNPQQQKQHQTQPMFANGQQTFWTACPFCSSRCRSYRDKMNKAIRCQSCKRPFIAYESNNQGSSHNGQKMAPENKQGNRGSAVPVSQPPTKTGRASVVGGAPKPKAKEDLNVRAEAGAEGKGVSAEPKLSGTKSRKRGRNSGLEEDSVRCNTGSSSNMEEVGNHEAQQKYGINSGRATRSTSRQKHDNVSNDNDIASGSRRKNNTINEPEEKVEKYERRVPLEESTPGGNAENCKKKGEEVSADDGPGTVVAEVPDPDLYDFDRDRSEECFAVDQMWAIFDDLDGMPRFYARVKKVYSPFKVDVTWLDFVAKGLDETAWRRNRLPVACGKFKHEKTETIEDICIFSHRIVWDKGVRNSYMIYPRKGETWALYKNWNIKWSSDPNNHRELEYEFIVVLSDYTHESGILVARLVKLKGFVCLFMPTKNDGMASFQIPSNEILRFSHRVPSFRTNGKERKDVPEGYFELDPASMPSNLEEVSDFIDVKADGKVDGSSKVVLEEKPHVPKKRKNPDEKSTLNGSTGRTRSSSRMSNDYDKNANAENIEKSIPKTFSASDGKVDGSSKVVLEEKPRMPKKRKNPDEKSTLNGSTPGRTRSSSRMSNDYDKNANEENIEKSIPKTFSASDGKVDGSSKVLLEEKPHMPKKRKNPVEKSTLNGSTPGRTRSSSRMSNDYDKNANEENIEKSIPKAFSTSVGVTAKTEGVSEQISSLITDPGVIPESESYFFEVDKTRNKFEAGQVWALYCELDGLPKYYAQIKKVESAPKFKVHIKWLKACTPPKGVLRWHDKKMPICCGVFSSGDKTEFSNTARFSHHLKGATAVKGYKYEIYPRKGEVWAIYRNFSSEWSSSDLQTCHYDICEVKTVDGAVKVSILEKVSDYETVFKGQRISGREIIVEIPRHELLRFSHQIPAIQLTDEKQGTLRGCWELDPKAMPVCFFNSK